MEQIGKSLIFAGIILFIIGGLFLLGGKVPFLGKLPGDIAIEKENFHFYFPISTSILISILLSVIFWLISHLKK